jgi:hypothetical protein
VLSRHATPNKPRILGSSEPRITLLPVSLRDYRVYIGLLARGIFLAKAAESSKYFLAKAWQLAIITWRRVLQLCPKITLDMILRTGVVHAKKHKEEEEGKRSNFGFFIDVDRKTETRSPYNNTR